MRNVMICTLQKSMGWSNQWEWDWRGMWYMWVKTEIQTVFNGRTYGERSHL